MGNFVIPGPTQLHSNRCRHTYTMANKTLDMYSIEMLWVWVCQDHSSPHDFWNHGVPNRMEPLPLQALPNTNRQSGRYTKKACSVNYISPSVNCIENWIIREAIASVDKIVAALVILPAHLHILYLALVVLLH